MSENILTPEVPVPAKPKKSKKKLWIVLASIVAVLAITATILFSCFGQYSGAMYKSKEEVYNYFNEKPHSSLCYDMSKYEKKLSKMEQELLAPDTALDDSVKNAAELPEKFDAILQEGNQLLIDFFADKYQIAVEAELAELRVVYASLPGLSGGGIYYGEEEGVTDGNVIALDIALVEDYDEMVADSEEALQNWKEQFYRTYLHECIHYLGTCYTDVDDASILYLVEGITEALTEAVFQTTDYEYYNDSVYVLNTQLAKQLLVADQDIVVLLIDGFEYVSADEFEDYFDSKSFDGMGDALGDSTNLTMGYTRKKYQRIAQHLMGEYLKHYDLTEDQMIEIADNFIAPISKFAD